MNNTITPTPLPKQPITTNGSLSSQNDSTIYHTPINQCQTRLSKNLTQMPSDWNDKIKGIQSACTTFKPNAKKELQRFEISNFDFAYPQENSRMITPTSKTSKNMPDAPLFKVVAWNPSRFDCEENNIDCVGESIPAKRLR